MDLFFLLSGFVLANAYERKFARGVTFRDFGLARVIRLYPLYVLALAIPLVKIAVQSKIGVHPLPWWVVGVQLGPAVFMAPSFFGPHVAAANPFPFNFSAWSLFFEIAVNALYAISFRFLSGRVLVMALVVNAAIMAAVTLSIGYWHGGSSWDTLWVGLPRSTLSFLGGVAIWRYAPRIPDLGWISASLVSVVLATAFLINPGRWVLFHDLLCVFIAFPLVIMFGAGIQLTGFIKAVADWSGRISYPLYVIHYPCAVLVGIAVARTAPSFGHANWFGPVLLVALCGISAMLDSIYDVPIRRWLTKLVNQRARNVA